MSGIGANYVSTSHIRHGLKVGLAGVLAYYLSGLIGIPYAYWAVVSTVIVMQMQVSDSIQMCLYRFTGTTIGAGIGIVAILVFPTTEYATLAGIFVTTGLCAYLTRYNVRFRMAAITVSIVYLTSVSEEHRIYFTLFRVAEIGIGVLCAFLVSVLVWPNRTGAVLRARLEKQYDELAAHYESVMENFLSRQQITRADIVTELGGEMKTNREMVQKVYSMEHRLFKENVPLLSLQVQVLNSVLERVQSMPILLNGVDGAGLIMASELMELTQATTEALRAIGAGISLDSTRLARAVELIEQRFSELYPQGESEQFEARRLVQMLGFIDVAHHLGEYVLDVLDRPELAGLAD